MNKLDKIQERDDTVEKLVKEFKRARDSNPDGACCLQAVKHHDCVCKWYWRCPVHGEHHVGTHD